MKKRTKRKRLSEIEREREILFVELLRADLQMIKREKALESYFRKKRVDYVR